MTTTLNDPLRTMTAALPANPVYLEVAIGARDALGLETFFAHSPDDAKLIANLTEKVGYLRHRWCDVRVMVRISQRRFAGGEFLNHLVTVDKTVDHADAHIYTVAAAVDEAWAVFCASGSF